MRIDFFRALGFVDFGVILLNIWVKCVIIYGRDSFKYFSGIRSIPIALDLIANTERIQHHPPANILNLKALTDSSSFIYLI